MKQAIRRGQPLPDAIAGAPSLWPGQGSIYRAFDELSTCRLIGFGAVGPIPWDKIDRYAERHGYTGDRYFSLVEIIRTMDDAFVAYMNKKAETGGQSRGVRPEDPTDSGQDNGQR